MQNKPRLIRITTVPMSLAYLLKGQSSFMQKNGLEVTMISADGKERELLKKEICPHVVVPMTRSITPFQDLKGIYELVKIFKKLKPDIVHTHTPKAGLLGMLAAKLSGVKIRIHTVAGLPLMVEKGLKLKILTLVEKVTYAAANHVWPNSNSLKNYILSHNLTSPKKLKVIGKGSSNGVDISRFNPESIDSTILQQIKAEINYDENNYYLLLIGRLVVDKGVVELVHAFNKLRINKPNLKLILAGQFEPDLDPLPDDVVTEINENENIIHIKWTDKVEYYLQLSNAFVFPSYREGFPNVLLEAGAMKLPIVCSRIAGSVDIVEDGVTGFIFESKNEADLEIVLGEALSQPQKMESMAGELQKIIIENYSRPMFWQTILEEYNNLLHCK